MRRSTQCNISLLIYFLKTFQATVAAAAPVVAAPVATNYALPPTRVIEEAPIVEQVVEPVEQHGYSVRY